MNEDLSYGGGYLLACRHNLMSEFILDPPKARSRILCGEILMDWDNNTQERFRAMIGKIPVFHRHITENAVTIKAQELAKIRNSSKVEEQDVVGAFFSDVPSPFYSMMVRLLEQTGFDYKKYGFPKNGK